MLTLDVTAPDTATEDLVGVGLKAAADYLFLMGQRAECELMIKAMYGHFSRPGLVIDDVGAERQHTESLALG